MPLPANALTTVATMEDELGIAANSATARLERLIAVASDIIERYCSRKFARQVGIVENVEGQGGQLLILRRTPIVQVTSIKYDGELVDATTYETKAEDKARGFVRRDAGWNWTAATFDAMSPVSAAGTEKRSYEVTYDAGYVLPKDGAGRDLPYDLEQACIELVTSLYRGRGRDKNIASESVGGASRSYVAVDGFALPPLVVTLLAAHRRAL